MARRENAIASSNAAEMAMCMQMEATVPSSHRWITNAMNVEYLQNATASLRATAQINLPHFDSATAGFDVVIPVSITDRDDVEVVHADITTWVTPANSPN